MKLIISENQYRRLLEVKHSTLLNEYENVDLGDGYQNLVPEFGNLLTHLSTLSLQNNTNTPVEVKSGKEIVVDTNKEELLKSLKDYIEGSRIDWETSEDNGKLTIKYKTSDKREDSEEAEDSEEIEDEPEKYKSWLGYLNKNLGKKKRGSQKHDYDIEDFSGNLYTPSYNDRDFGYTDGNGKVYGLGSRSGISQICKDAQKENNPEKIKRYCKKHNHYGEDYPVKQGTEIYSKMGGVVLKAEITSNNCGGTLNIKMDDGTTSKFCHLSKIFVKKGDKISKNNLIALSGGKRGSTGAGSSTGPHIHYGLKNSRGITVDPVGKEEKYWGIKIL